MSRDFADRIAEKAGDDVATQVEWAWQYAVGRKPMESEKNLAVEFVKQHGLQSLARALFNVNEFVAIE